MNKLNAIILIVMMTASTNLYAQNDTQNTSAIGSPNISYDEGTSYSYSAPGLSPAVGTEAAQIGTIFGSLSVANTEDYVKNAIKSRVLVELFQVGLVTRDQAIEEAVKILRDMSEATEAKRFLGVGWKTRGKHLFNLFGFLATDSWRGTE